MRVYVPPVGGDQHQPGHNAYRPQVPRCGRLAQHRKGQQGPNEGLQALERRHLRREGARRDCGVENSCHVPRANPMTGRPTSLAGMLFVSCPPSAPRPQLSAAQPP